VFEKNFKSQIIEAMKKLLLITGMLLITVVTMQAQTRDTLKNKEQKRAENKYDKKKKEIGTQEEATTNMRDRKKVMVKDVPPALRQTLDGPDYKGWDETTSTIYSDRTGNRFTVEIRNGNSAKIYHFDKEGNRIDAGSLDRE
jgi:hypothetical protein